MSTQQEQVSIQTNPRLISYLKIFSQAATAIVILVGCLVPIGWIFDISTLKSMFPGLVTMKANTAVAGIKNGAHDYLMNEQGGVQ